MVRQYQNLTQLHRDLSKIIADVVLVDLRDEIVRIWLEHQAELVYDTYDPIQYVRRADQGGLADPENIESFISGAVTKELHVRLENMTHPVHDAAGQFLNRLIEGKEGFAGDPNMGMPARPYTQPAIEYMQKNPARLKKVITEGFMRHGIRVNIK